MIIGAMKAGTTSLFHYLADHPHICPAVTKEPEFFSENQGHARKFDKYEDCFRPNYKMHSYCLDASTGYTKYPSERNVPKSIFEYGIKPKFIYVLRNPIKRIESQYNFMQKYDKPWSYNDNLSYLLDLSKYAMQLDQYMHFFKREDVLLLDFEELKIAPQSVLKKVYTFLELDFYNSNKINKQYNKTRKETLKADRYKKKVDARFAAFPKIFRDVLKFLISKKYRIKPMILNESQKNNIYLALREDIERLKKVYNFSTSHWKL